MGRFLIIDGVGAAIILAAWYLALRRYNQQKGLRVLRWVEKACAGRGRITNMVWTSSSRLLADLRFPPQAFDHARVVVRLRPRPLPVRWAFSCWRNEKETLSFEADLSTAPRFQLEVHNHRWSGHNSNSLSSKNWVVSRPGPVVLTSRTAWNGERTPVINALMASREKNYLSIRFSPDSPHFSAMLDIESLPPDTRCDGWLESLRELAAGASASRQ
jgi:hypothetical protein